MNKKLIGHNQPPIQLEDFLILDADGNSTGRIKFTNTVIRKHLTRKLNAKQQYVERVINDSEKIGLKAKINPGGSKSFFYQVTTKGKRNPDKHHLGNFPEMKVEAARSLVEDLKQAIKLGRDPKTVIEERRKAKTLSAAIALWKEKILYKATRYKQSTIDDVDNRFKNWIDLNSIHPKTNRVILNNRSDLNIGTKRMVEITKDDLIAYHAAISKSGKYQANRIIDDLKVIFKWAKENNIIKENICNFNKEELNPEYTRLDEVDPYSREEWRMIRKAAVKLYKNNPRVFLACMAVLLTLYHGRRYKSELLTLKWTQIDWDMNKVLLHDTKTGKSQFSLNRLSRWVLRQLWKYKKVRFKNIKSIKSRYLFPATRKSKKPYVQDIRKTWIKICAAAGVRKLEIYMLKHTWGCLALLATNGNVKAVKDEGGWKTYKMVERYSKFNKKQLTKYSEDIGNYLAHAK
jgi:integrase